MRRVLRLGCGLFLLLVCAVIIAVAIDVFSSPQSLAKSKQTTTTLNARFYLTQDILKQRLQAGINQQLPQIAAAQEGQLGGILAGALHLQPTATITSITSGKQGITTGLDVTLFPGAQAIHTSLYTTFKNLNSSTIQVNGTLPPNSPISYDGPLTTIAIPKGKITNVQTISNCGSAILAVDLQFPINQIQAQLTPSGNRVAPLTSTTFPTSYLPLSFAKAQGSKVPQDQTPIYAEIPATSLAALTNDAGTLALGNGLYATNIQLNIKNQQLIVTTDIYSSAVPGRFIKIGTTSTTMVPVASHGQLQLQVRSTNLQSLIFTIPVNEYNRQIEQTVNNKLKSAINGNFTVNTASIGPGSQKQVPCVAANSFFLTGSANITI